MYYAICIILFEYVPVVQVTPKKYLNN